MANEIESTLVFNAATQSFQKIEKQAEKAGKESGDAFGDGFKKGTGNLDSGISKSLNSIKLKLAGVAAAFAGAFLGKAAVQESINVENSLIGLSSVAAATGNSVSAVTDAAKDLAADGLVPLQDVSGSLKNLLVTFNGDLGKSVQAYKALANAAAFNRQEALGFGEAIRGASEGLKNDLSSKIDNAGITKNLSILQKEYAASIGKTIGQLTNAEKTQAKFTGIIREAKIFQGDYNKLQTTFSGIIAETGSRLRFLAAGFGDLVTSNPAVKDFLKTVNTGLKDFTLLLKNEGPFLESSLSKIVNFLLVTPTKFWLSKLTAPTKSLENLNKEIANTESVISNLENKLAQDRGTVGGFSFNPFRTTKREFQQQRADLIAELTELKTLRDKILNSGDKGGASTPKASPVAEIDPGQVNRLKSQLEKIGLTREQILRQGYDRQLAIVNEAEALNIDTEIGYAERKINLQSQLNKNLLALRQDQAALIAEEQNARLLEEQLRFEQGLTSAELYQTAVGDINEKAAQALFNLKINAEGLTQVLPGIAVGFNKTAKGVIAASKQMAAIVKSALVDSISQGIQTIIMNLRSGQNALTAFKDLLLGVFGDMAIKLGAVLIGSGIGIEALNSVSGTGAIAAGIGLIAVGALLKSFTGGGGSSSASAGTGNFTGAGGGGGVATSSPEIIQEREREDPRGQVNVTIQGDVLDSDSSAIRIIELINEAQLSQGAVLTAS